MAHAYEVICSNCNKPTTVSTREIELINALRRVEIEAIHAKCIGSCHVDIYIPKTNSIIELDGDEHGFPDRWKSDERKDKYLKGLGFKVKRYDNKRVDDHVEGLA